MSSDISYEREKPPCGGEVTEGRQVHVVGVTRPEVSKVLPQYCHNLPDPGVCGENCVEGVLTVRQAVAALGRGLEKRLDCCHN